MEQLYATPIFTRSCLGRCRGRLDRETPFTPVARLAETYAQPFFRHTGEIVDNTESF
jgi:hypothetical protein